MSHQIAFFATPILVSLLIARAHGLLNITCAIIYGASLALLFGVSALYHRRHWQPKTRDLLGRLDLSTIYFFMVGCYTPLCLLGVGGTRGSFLLAGVSLASLSGIARVTFLPDSTKLTHTVFYIPMGVFLVVCVSSLAPTIGVGRSVLLLIGGVLYVIGAMVYGLERPNPLPRVFGYHEIFHALVIFAAACHYQVIAALICPA